MYHQVFIGQLSFKWVHVQGTCKGYIRRVHAKGTFEGYMLCEDLTGRLLTFCPTHPH